MDKLKKELESLFNKRLTKVLEHVRRELPDRNKVLLIPAPIELETEKYGGSNLISGPLYKATGWSVGDILNPGETINYIADSDNPLHLPSLSPEKILTYRKFEYRSNAVGFALDTLRGKPGKPLTVGDALDCVEQGHDKLVCDTIQELIDCAGETITGTGDSKIFTDAVKQASKQWPWTIYEPEGVTLHLLMAFCLNLPEEELIAGSFPGKVAPLDMAEWLHPTLNRQKLEPEEFRRLIVMEWCLSPEEHDRFVKENKGMGDVLMYISERWGIPVTLNWRNRNGKEIRWTGAGLAVLYLACHWQKIQSKTAMTPAPLLWENHLHVMSPSHYQAVREALAMNTFGRIQDSPWPTARLEKGGSYGNAQLRPMAIDSQPMLPPEEMAILERLMWEQRRELSDIDADALDALSAIWLAQAKSPESDAIADVDDLLKLRGLERKRSGSGRRGGYKTEQRAAILKAISHIQSLWINMAEVDIYEETSTKHRRRKRETIQSRAFTISDRMGQLRLDGYMDVSKFVFRPGKVFARFLFGPGRQTALLSVKALQYDPYRQQWEKRLARYLSWQWRTRARDGNYMQPYRVSTLLEAVGEDVNPRFPSRTRERLEKALEILKQDGVITAWQYDRWDEFHAEHRRWAEIWLQATIQIEPPDIIGETYKNIQHHEVPKQISDAESLGERIKQRRKALGLSLSQASEQLGISSTHLNRLENNRRGKKLSSAIKTKIETWLTGEA